MKFYTIFIFDKEE